MNNSMVPRIVPFILFMAFIGFEEAGRFLADKGSITLTRQSIQYLYPIKIISVGAVLFYFRNQYHEIELKQLFIPLQLTISVICGLTVFVLWIQVDFFINPLGSTPGYNPLLFKNQETRNIMIIARLAGAVLVVPIMEEIFWRSFFIRYIINPDFSKVDIGRATWSSFLITTLLFGLEHNLFFAGIMAGIFYNLLLYYTRSITHVILAHATTNLLLGIYVLSTNRWSYW